jgi:hypothetical protein
MSIRSLFDDDHAPPTTDPVIAETLTEMFQQALLRFDTIHAQEEAVAAFKISVRKALAAGLDPRKVVILDTSSHVNLASMQNLVEVNRARVKERDDIIRQKDARITELESELKNKSGMSWEDRLRAKAARLWIEGKKKGIDGKGMVEIANEIAAATNHKVTVNMLTQQFYNNPPPEGLRAVVRKSGVPDWPELWKLGASLRDNSAAENGRDRSWGLSLARAMGYSNGKGGWKLPFLIGGDLSKIDMTKLNKLRANYLSKHGEEKSPSPFHGFERIAAEKLVVDAGILGITRKELLSKGLDSRRVGDLYDRLSIIQISGPHKNRGRDSEKDPIRYVHVTFREHFEDEFEFQRDLLATESFNRAAKRINEFADAVN